jgi:hypothetical protein
MQYLTLTNLTGGESSDICEDDWTSKFERLATNVVTSPMGRIQLPEPVKNGVIKSVKVNGQVLEASQFDLDDMGIQLGPQFEKLARVDLQIEYMP